MNSLLTVLSPAIKQLKKLKMLFVSGNPFIVEGIRSVMELEDTCKIDTFFSDIQGESRKFLFIFML